MRINEKKIIKTEAWQRRAVGGEGGEKWNLRNYLESLSFSENSYELIKDFFTLYPLKYKTHNRKM